MDNLQQIRSSIKIISIVVAVIFSILFIRMAYISIYKGYSSEPIRFFSKNNNISRYDILDRNNNALALNLSSFSAYVTPKTISEPNKVVNALVEGLGMPEERAVNIVNSSSNFVWIKRNLSKEEEHNLRLQGAIDIKFEKSQYRYYPHGELFSHVVGITDIDSNGISGVESSFNDDLKKENIQLSIDLQLQNILYEELLVAYEKNQAKSAAGMIIDPKTSEVLAMVSLPSFDPNNRANFSIDSLFNNNTQAIVEPGSIAKIFSVAIAVDSNVAGLSSVYDVSKPIVIRPYIIVDYEHHDTTFTTPEILMFSSNIGTSLLMRETGKALQRKYLERLNLFKQTSLEIPEKESSIYPASLSDVNSLTISYGYGLAMSQATFINAYASIINGGIYRPLTLLKRNPEDQVEETRVISEESSKYLRGMLRLTVSNGYGSRAEVEGLHVAGKTGSAEKFINGKYDTDKVISSFAGFFPAYDPKYMLVIFIDEPKRLPYNGYSVTGGLLSAPVASKVIERTALAKGIPRNSAAYSTSHLKPIPSGSEKKKAYTEYIRSLPYLEIE